jgi:nucleotide-binding universal stress UspA family protein
MIPCGHSHEDGGAFCFGGIRVTSDVRRGEPVAEIVAAARETGADIIAMTTHGRSGFSRLLLGSVAEAVLRQAECQCS